MTPSVMIKQLLLAVLPDDAAERLRRFVWEFGLPSAARRAIRHDLAGELAPDPGPAACIEELLVWLGRAQDNSLSEDGGFARDWGFLHGWTASYPETTGYIIPTLIDQASHARPQLLTRARRALDWLLTIQMDNGAFPGGRIDQRPIVPVSFNTGQILFGLVAGARAFADPALLAAAHRAAAFLRDSLDPDGVWRRYPSPFALGGDKVYDTHVAWALFEADRLDPNHGYGAAGMRQVRWALTRQTDNGWFSDNCLDWPEAPLTHTIGYALRGLIEAWRWSCWKGDEDATLLAAAIRTADALAGCIDEAGRIPGQLDRNWKSAASYVCITGNAQIAACWHLLAGPAGRADWAELARRATGFARRTISDYGVPGSYPVDGAYCRLQYPNWAAKFLIDACQMELDPPHGPGPDQRAGCDAPSTCVT